MNFTVWPGIAIGVCSVPSLSPYVLVVLLNLDECRECVRSL